MEGDLSRDALSRDVGRLGGVALPSGATADGDARASAASKSATASDFSDAAPSAFSFAGPSPSRAAVSPRVASASFAASRRLFFALDLGRLVFFATTVLGASPPRAAALFPRGAFFARGLGDLGGVTGGDVPVPGDPGEGGEAARRFGCRTARETRPASARRAGVTGRGGGGAVSESRRGR